MIIDSHYHYMASMSEKAAAEIVELVFREAGKLGMNPDHETLLRTAAQTWGDPLAALGVSGGLSSQHVRGPGGMGHPGL